MLLLDRAAGAEYRTKSVPFLIRPKWSCFKLQSSVFYALCG